MRFQSAFATFEPQNHSIVEQFGHELFHWSARDLFHRFPQWTQISQVTQPEDDYIIQYCD